MVARNAVVVTERREDAPTRRILYEPIETRHYLRREQVWRESIEGWHDVGCEEVVVDVEVSR
jgi:hypothetical protein